MLLEAECMNTNYCCSNTARVVYTELKNVIMLVQVLSKIRYAFKINTTKNKILCLYGSLILILYRGT